VVYIGSYEGNVYALNAGIGALVWKFGTAGRADSSPAVANGVVYVGSDDNNIYALDAGTGALLWKYDTGGQVYCSPAVADGVLYISSFVDGNTFAFGLPGGLP
jgi:eukaryotic-like serine/threonine-protein kinase